MCGITGILAFTEKGRQALGKINDSVRTLEKRGPDGEGIYKNENLALGHRRLAVIDTSEAASQPFSDTSGRYTIIFNGEFFNYKIHREELIKKGIALRSNSDTEVLLYLFIEYGHHCLDKINGFFSFAIYDKESNELFLARDRYGIKPLLIYKDENIFAFASEMKALLAYGIPRKLDEASLFTYLHLNYIPSPASIFVSVSKLEPGHFMVLRGTTVINSRYYAIPQMERNQEVPSYELAKNQLFGILEQSVRSRLLSDVPLGCFLSGGIDSSIIALLASKNTTKLKTFSMGFREEPLFDETRYAQIVSKKFNTDHTVFSFGNAELFESLHQVMDYLDEPFADASALAVYILSKNTRKHVTVALSGDGSDELFGGYNKHAAEFNLRRLGPFARLLSYSGPFWNLLPKSRNSLTGNKIRQLKKLSKGSKLTMKERYWSWAGYSDDQAVANLLKSDTSFPTYKTRKENLLKELNPDFNSLLLTDFNLVLQNDMLVKVDTMSMANGLETRVPFLDLNVVNYVFSLPAHYKINTTGRKRLLKDAFKDFLPEEIVSRKKQGFEVPLLKWFRTDLKSMITEDLLGKKFIEEQGLFNYPAICSLLQKLFSADPDDSVARVWGLIVFQTWWKKYMI